MKTTLRFSASEAKKYILYFYLSVKATYHSNCDNISVNIDAFPRAKTLLNDELDTVAKLALPRRNSKNWHSTILP